MTCSTPARPSFGSDTTTSGVRVIVAPRFLPDQSGGEETPYVFGYRIRIANLSDIPCTLRTRRWVIIDADGDQRVVEGDKVVGKEPRLLPGEQFEYTSYCPLATPWGTMEGSFGFQSDDGSRFPVIVGRFFLVADQESVHR